MVPLVEVDGEIVSSSRIRSLVAAGEVEVANRCLGAPFLLEGLVVEGDGRGRDARLPDREPRARRTIWSPPGTACMRPSPTGSPRP